MMRKGVDVLLFNDCVSNNYIWSRTAGPYRIATELRKLDYTVQVVDWFSYMVVEDLELAKVLINKFVGSSTTVVGFSLTFFNNLYALKRKREAVTGASDRAANKKRNTAWSVLDNSEIKEIIDHIKAINPKIKIVVGGAGLSDNVPFADVICLGYGERHIIDYMQWLKGKNPFFRWRTIPARPNVLILDYDTKASIKFDFQQAKIQWHASDCILPGETLPIEISRGCVFSCKFCAFPLNGKKKLDHIKHEDVLYEEFMFNYENFGTTRYVFSDDTYNDSLEKLHLMNRIGRRLPFKLEFGTYARLDLIAAHPEQIELLEENGLKAVFFGIESLNYEAAKAIGKGIKTERALELLYKLRDSWGHRVLTTSGFIFGLPNDDIKSIESWSEKILDHRFPLHSIIINPLGIADTKRVPSIFMSEFDKYPEKYGYEFNDGADPWKWNNVKSGTTFTQMDKLANTVRNYATAMGRTGYSAQLTISMASFGITTDNVRMLGRRGVETQLPGDNIFYTHFLQYLRKLSQVNYD